jgi:uncharacterized protein YnzC (UPF0291/DUF896 family)
MGHSNYQLSDEEKKQLDKLAKIFIDKIEDALADDVGGILDPYEGRDLNNDKLTAMIWYIGDYISAS